MGTTYSARCNCGYKKEEINVGSTFFVAQEAHYYFPHYCPNCKIIFVGDLRSKEPICCDECGSNEVLSYFDEKICKPFLRQKINTKSNSANSLLERIMKVFRWSKRIETKEPEYESICALERCEFLCPACGEFSLSFECEGFYG